MTILQDVKDFFNNQSVGAFIGAFAAFTLVVLMTGVVIAERSKTLPARLKSIACTPKQNWKACAKTEP